MHRPPRAENQVCRQSCAGCGERGRWRGSAIPHALVAWPGRRRTGGPRSRREGRAVPCSWRDVFVPACLAGRRWDVAGTENIGPLTYAARAFPRQAQSGDRRRRCEAMRGLNANPWRPLASDFRSISPVWRRPRAMRGKSRVPSTACLARLSIPSISPAGQGVRYRRLTSRTRVSLVTIRSDWAHVTCKFGSFFASRRCVRAVYSLSTRLIRGG